MLSHYSWGQYWSALATGLAIYYFFIAVIFYRKDIALLLRHKLRHHGSGSKDQNPRSEPRDQKTGLDGLQPVVTDIKAIMENAGSRAEKAALIEAFKDRVRHYDGIRLPAFRNAINGYIIRNAEIICGVGISEDELEAAWQSLPR